MGRADRCESVDNTDPAESTVPAGPELPLGERGQGMVEYALIMTLVVLVVIVMLQVLGHQVNNLYSNISNGLTLAGG